MRKRASDGTDRERLKIALSDDQNPQEVLRNFDKSLLIFATMSAASIGLDVTGFTQGSRFEVGIWLMGYVVQPAFVVVGLCIRQKYIRALEDREERRRREAAD